jgi:8-oxo-dGTP diphosphatase
MEQMSSHSEVVKQESLREPSRALMKVSVTTVVFTFDGAKLRVVGIAHVNGQSHLTLPRYSFESGMDFGDAARLAVKLNCGLNLERFFQVGAFSLPPEENQNSAVEVCFLAVTSIENCRQLFEKGRLLLSPMNDLSQFDAQSVSLIQSAFLELRKRTRFENLGFYLLSDEFSLSELQKMFEAVMGRSIDVRNFRKKIEALGILEESPNKPKGMAYRPPRLYTFNSARFQEKLEIDGEVRFF